jgi:hypothetical protein
MERSLAVAAGLGFIGKNNLLILPGFGSYFYLAEIFTTAMIPFDRPNLWPGNAAPAPFAWTLVLRAPLKVLLL